MNCLLVAALSLDTTEWLSTPQGCLRTNIQMLTLSGVHKGVSSSVGYLRGAESTNDCRYGIFPSVYTQDLLQISVSIIISSLHVLEHSLPFYAAQLFATVFLAQQPPFLNERGRIQTDWLKCGN